MITDRDTHFAGFAKLLLQEMFSHTQWDGIDFTSNDVEEVREYRLIIARRAYDLMSNAINAWGFPPAMLYIGDAPDMIEWPKVQE